MTSRPIIKHLDIIEVFCWRGFPSLEDVTADFLLFQAPQEGLDRRVILTVASATHTREQAMRLAEPMPFISQKSRKPPAFFFDFLNDDMRMLRVLFEYAHEGISNLLNQLRLLFPCGTRRDLLIHVWHVVVSHDFIVAGRPQ